MLLFECRCHLKIPKIVLSMCISNVDCYNSYKKYIIISSMFVVLIFSSQLPQCILTCCVVTYIVVYITL